ncbi:MAG: sulfatase [Eubacteriales bacterium]|nr:sulfatase [Eubacteriales bacterium]
MKAVMLMFDSLNREMLEPYGCDWTKTPNFQRLAQHSVRFDQCYAGSLPCMPARRELQTGRYNFLHRSWGPVEPFDDSVPQILKDHGVYTHLVSDHVHYWEDGGSTYHYRYNSWEMIRGQEGDKWKCLPELFDSEEEARIQNKDGQYFCSTRDLQRHDEVNRKFMKTEGDMALAKTIRCGLEYLDANHACDRWFLQIECFDPHEPFFVSEDCEELYPDAYEGERTDWPPYHHVTEDAVTAEHYKYRYATLLSLCDKYLGKLLDKFDELGLWEDTMLIVNTDHGYLLGEHGWWSKVVMPCYDEIVHTPLFIHDPRFACDGEVRKEIVQTIDIAATLLEYFGIECPADMQGKPIRTVIEKDEPIRDCALFGIHGAHINIFDGRYVYMKAPASENNLPLYEYTTMPMHMRNLFSVGELRKAEAVPGDRFAFTKGCPVWKIPKGNGNGERDFSDLLINGKDSEEAKHIDNNSLVNAANFGDKLFDMELDSHQEHELDDVKVETRMANLLRQAMKENDCPSEQFQRIGFSEDSPVTEDDVQKLHEEEKLKIQPLILPQYQWTKGAVNTYRALMKFIPAAQKEEAVSVLEREIPHYVPEGRVESHTVLACIPMVVPEEYVDMVQYFVDLSGRTS